MKVEPIIGPTAGRQCWQRLVVHHRNSIYTAFTQYTALQAANDGCAAEMLCVCDHVAMSEEQDIWLC